MKRVILVGALLVLGCDKKPAPSVDNTIEPTATTAASAAPAPAVPVAIAKPLKDWQLGDITAALKAGGYSLGISQSSTGDDGAGTTNEQLRAVATRAGKRVEVFLIRYQGDGGLEGVKSSRGTRERAVVHQEGPAALFCESDDAPLAKETAIALLGKQPSG